MTTLVFDYYIPCSLLCTYVLRLTRADSLAFTLQIIDLKRDPYGTLDKRGKPTIKTVGNVPKNPLQTMEDKLRIANKVNKKYKELMNELDENINQATEDIGNDEAKALLENKRNLTAEKSKNLSLKPRPFKFLMTFGLPSRRTPPVCQFYDIGHQSFSRVAFIS